MADIDYSKLSDAELNKLIEQTKAEISSSKPKEESSGGKSVSELSDKELNDMIRNTRREALREEGRKSVKESIEAPPEYIEVPSYDPTGMATGYTERVIKGNKADPVGRGVLSVLPFGEDIAAWARSGKAPMTEEHSAEKERIAGEAEAAKEAYEGPYRLGQAGSLVGQMIALRRMPLPGSKWGTAALPAEATLAQRAGALGARTAGGAAGGATLGGISGLGEGTTLEDRLQHGAMGTLVGGAVGAAAVPALEGVLGAGKFAYNKFIAPNVERARAAMNPTQVAEETVARNFQSGRGMTDDEFAASIAAGEPLMLADVGGEPIRSVARYAANTSPEARQTLNEAIYPRVQSQTDRVVREVENMFPNAPDYATEIAALKTRGRAERKPAYDRAYEQGSSGVFNDDLYNLMQAPAVKDAMKDVTRRAKNQEVYGEPIGDIVDPFAFNKEGQLIAKEGMKATDANLRYWDIVKQNLDDTVSELYRKGRGGEAGDVANIRNQLRDVLDDIVPSYKNARGTAQEFFKAGDAFEAGINLSKFSSPEKISEAFKVWKGMSDAEKEMFARGYASNLIGKINNSKDKNSIINQTFLGGSRTEKAKLLMALGQERAAALEARVRAEALMDQLRPAVTGGSTTTRQLAEQALYGSVGAGAGAYSGEDMKSASLGGVTALLLRAGKGKIDASVSNEIAKILVSRDPAMLGRISALAGKNPKVNEVLREVPPSSLKKLFEKQPGSNRAMVAGQSGAAAANED